jgi:hypothetical protein
LENISIDISAFVLEKTNNLISHLFTLQERIAIRARKELLEMKR